MRRHKVAAYLDTGVARDLAALAARRRVPATRIVEAAVASFLSPDSADQTEAAITRRLDRLTRTMERLERDQEIPGEALALFIRFWLTATPPVPDDLREAVQAKGRERHGSFVETLARRLAKGTTLSKELTRELSAAPSAQQDGEGRERSGRRAAFELAESHPQNTAKAAEQPAPVTGGGTPVTSVSSSTLHKGRITNWFTADSGTEIQHIDPVHRPSGQI